MTTTLAFDLHVLTARLDRAADQYLRAEHGITYSRFLALSLVARLGVSTQRALADALGVTEPSVSRMVGVLRTEGLLETPGGRGRGVLTPTDRGAALVASVQDALEDRFTTLVAASGVPYEEYAAHTARLVATLAGGAATGAR